MLFAEQVSDHARLLLPTVQMATDSRHHLDFGGWTALAQCVGLDVLIEQLVGGSTRDSSQASGSVEDDAGCRPRSVW